MSNSSLQKTLLMSFSDQEIHKALIQSCMPTLKKTSQNRIQYLKPPAQEATAFS